MGKPKSRKDVSIRKFNFMICILLFSLGFATKNIEIIKLNALIKVIKIFFISTYSTL